ncbi:23S rRNA (pseudouridine(1915)-N(3))-methyltransferase RlmH [candidate division KSB1 bacterium]|nr:MAG: 23S rRNA (pseudouridine(1915)-N(3))-methyltransferase RlmH [candidate division KSB1 bacterium]
MNLTIIAVGKLRESYYRAGVEDYLQRIKRFLPIEQIETAIGTGEEGNGKGKGALLREAEGIERHLIRGGKIVVLDAAGTSLSSEEFSEWIQKTMNSAVSRVNFIVGGAWGLAPKLIDRADMRLSLSSMTLPHELARLVLVEQIYRALSLWKGLPYHK